MTDAAPATAVAIAEGYSFTSGRQAPRFHVRRRVPMTAFTEDCVVRIAVAGLVPWVSHLCSLSVPDAHQWVSQVVRLRIGNRVNSLSTVAAFVSKHDLPGSPPVLDDVHARPRSLASGSRRTVTRLHPDLPA